MTVLLKIARWALQKFAGAFLIIGLALACYGLVLFLRDNVDVDRRRAERITALEAERDILAGTKAELESRIAAYQREVQVQRAKVEQAQKVLAGLKALESWWDRWFGDSSQQALNAERARKVEQLHADSARMVTEISRMITQTNWEKDGAEIALRRVEAELEQARSSESTAAHYLRRAWQLSKWYVVFAVAGYFFGPTLWAATMYFGLGPLAARGRPIRLAPEMSVFPVVGASHVSLQISLRPGEILRIKEKFLQASDEGVRKSTRFVLDWRIPLTSLACGLVELVELGSPATAAAAPSETAEREAGYRVTLSNSDDPHEELALIEVPAGGALILRPSFLAGVIQRANERLVIRRRWQVFRWQAWITGQFRFFEFVGPCRLIVAGSRGVRAEVLAARENGGTPARRTNQDATIGFTPNLDYRPVRAETFWSYYRGMNPLFDDLFAGQGVFVLQETSTRGDAAKLARFWSGVWGGILKIFGL